MKTNNTHSNRFYKNLLYCFVLFIMLHVVAAEKSRRLMSRRLMNKRASTTSECHFKGDDFVYNEGGGVVGKEFFMGKMFSRCNKITYHYPHWDVKDWCIRQTSGRYQRHWVGKYLLRCQRSRPETLKYPACDCNGCPKYFVVERTRTMCRRRMKKGRGSCFPDSSYTYPTLTCACDKNCLHREEAKKAREEEAAKSRRARQTQQQQIDENEKRLDNAHKRADEIIKSIGLSNKRADEIMKVVDTSKTKADEVHAAANGQHAKLKRMWASEDVRIKYEKLRASRVKDDALANQNDCANEKAKLMTVFSTVALKEEVDENTCINRNRDELIEAFCNFRSDFDTVLEQRGLNNSKHYWPNICCKDVEPKTFDCNCYLERYEDLRTAYGSDCKKAREHWKNHGEKEGRDPSCKDPCRHPGIMREKIVPFALTQGGPITFGNLYGEVKDVLKKDGYLHKGMINVLKDIGSTGKSKELSKTINAMFDEASLCGPRTFRSPQKEESMMCQLFYPYKHMLSMFHNALVDVASEKTTSFLQVMEARRLNGEKQQPMSAMLQRKQSAINANGAKIAQLEKANEARSKKTDEKLFGRLKSWLVSFVKNDDTLRGKDGKDGVDGKKGDKGDTGSAGTGLTLKTFRIGHQYNKGDYVFAKAKDRQHNSMFIAERNFKAKKEPSNDLDNWDEFTAPRGPKGDAGRDGKDGVDGKDGKDGADGKDGKDGVDGKKGDKGDTGSAGKDGRDGVDGKDGRDGNDGLGLHLRKFQINTNYVEGDYVFAKSTKGNHNTMFVAEKKFKAAKVPSKDLGNWEEFEAPKGDKGESGRMGERGAQGAAGQKGPKGDAGRDGKDGVDGKDGKDGKEGKDGKDVTVKPMSPKIKEALDQRSAAVKKNVKSTKVIEMMKSKARTSNDGTSTCPRVTGVNPDQLDKYKQMFCPPYRHLDLEQGDAANVAMVYVEDDINPKNKGAIAKLKRDAKYIVDDGCSSPLFTAKDISLQEIAVNAKQEREWVALVQLDSRSENGYLQNELAHCKNLDYVPQTRVSVGVEVREPKICTKEVCSILKCQIQSYQCGWKYVPAKHYHTKEALEYTVDMTGTTYELKTGHGGRRRLLMQHKSGC